MSMGRLGLAFRVFFRTLPDAFFAQKVRALMDETGALPPAPAGATAPAATPAASPPAAKPVRSDAGTLLAVLQREARLVDFLKESISAYDDAKIGAAVRDVHRGAAAVLDRLFELRPVMTEADGASVQVPAGADAARVRLVGNV